MEEQTFDSGLPILDMKVSQFLYRNLGPDDLLYCTLSPRNISLVLTMKFTTAINAITSTVLWSSIVRGTVPPVSRDDEGDPPLGIPEQGSGEEPFRHECFWSNNAIPCGLRKKRRMLLEQYRNIAIPYGVRRKQ